MSANDDLPSIRAELELIEQALADGLPFLGICLGAQLLARALGAAVAPHPEGHAEIGYYPVRATPEGGKLFEMGHHVYQWHMEGFEQPAGSTLLATGEAFPNQAFRYADNAYGIQFHPEVTPEIMESWLEDSPERLSLPGAQCPGTQRDHQRIHHRPLGLWLDRFLDHWLLNTGFASACQLPAPDA
jgi:GMP synthase (glutamine-hydrolysing)